MFKINYIYASQFLYKKQMIKNGIILRFQIGYLSRRAKLIIGWKHF